MIGFFIKKAFFDGWDNLLILALLNLGFVLLLLAFLALPMLIPYSAALTLALLVLIVYLFFLYAGGVSVFTSHFMSKTSPELKQIPQYMREVWKVSVAFATITVVQIFILMIGFPFYFSIGGIIGLAAASILFWVSILWWLIAMWIYPVRSQIGTTPKEVLKKSLLLFFDNPGFSIFLGFYTLINILLSLVTVFLIPGVGGILHSHQIALKLRLYKYEYLEENPESSRKTIPWEALLIDEKEQLGQRSLKGMIFPWKE